MKAIQLTGPKRIEVVDAPKPALADGEVLVRNQRLSICGSDMRSYRPVAPEEEYPFAAGAPCHECLGVVEESRVSGIAPGQRVIALTNPSAPSGYGGGAEYLVTDARRIIPLPDEGDPNDWIMCQPMGTVLFACQRMGSVLGKSVVVLGQGAIGLSFTSLLASLGARELVSVDLHDYRLEKSRQRGATTTLNPLRDNVPGAVAELTGGEGADVVVEASGTVEAMNQMADLARRYGTLVLFGLPEQSIIPFDYAKLVRKQPIIIPTQSSMSEDPAQSIKEAVSLVGQGRLDVSWLVTHRLPFEEAPRAYEMYEGYLDNIVKVVIEM